MPTLSKYAQSNQKTGYFVKANVGGSHPVTLQTTDVAERVFKDNGYSDGSTVPTKLIWSMYDTGLLYTNTTISASTLSHSYDSLSKAITDSRLTEPTRNKLIEYFESYSGPNQVAITDLLEDIRLTVSSDTIEEYDPENPLETAKSFVEAYNQRPEYQIDALFDRGQDWAVDSVLTFSQRASQLEKIEIKGTILGYHLSPISVSGKARVYDRRFLDRHDHDYRIEYQDSKMISLQVQNGRITSSNGPENLLTLLEARQLTEETTPVEINENDVRYTIDSPPSSRITIPEKSFLQGDKELLVGAVDRISNNNNPLVELTDGHILLDAGEKGEIYLINRVDERWGRVLCKFSID